MFEQALGDCGAHNKSENFCGRDGARGCKESASHCHPVAADGTTAQPRLWTNPGQGSSTAKGEKQRPPIWVVKRRARSCFPEARGSVSGASGRASAGRDAELRWTHLKRQCVRSAPWRSKASRQLLQAGSSQSVVLDQQHQCHLGTC